ncbi:nucleotidyltransferase domain-containing protein [Aquiflexum sp. LQ15W]|uniref:nucleotidyltransferase family protein n=1 Tax=Cognataquiflexum nitidum TaxID=2922272 RepID=UPI001F148E0D|nr:nucleotidyltransferase domain-containing protein [Cognataquiflexum nitidum]MCH6200084.1 nucleotidyltransferase domain-containing protein [Cognataquiflexum nitidum]
MNEFGLLERDLEEILSVLEKFPKIEKAIVFGSRAKGNYKNGSDVDIALKGRHLDFETISHVSYLLNEETRMPYKFDVLNYHSIQEQELKNHIDRIGVEIYNGKNLKSVRL